MLKTHWTRTEKNSDATSISLASIQCSAWTAFFGAVAVWDATKIHEVYIKSSGTDPVWSSTRCLIPPFLGDPNARLHADRRRTVQETHIVSSHCRHCEATRGPRRWVLGPRARMALGFPIFDCCSERHDHHNSLCASSTLY